MQQDFGAERFASHAKRGYNKIMEAEKEHGELNWVFAAGIVGADIGTSVFYGTGILFPIVGYLSPLFILIACLTMWIFKRTYEEGLAMSPYNGGAYSMILRSLGRRMAVAAGALTVVSYLATAAVSSLSGAYYFSSLFEGGLSVPTILWISFIPVVLFGLLNIKGIKEPAKIVTGVALAHFALLIIISFWGLIYLAFHWSEVNFSKFSNFFNYPKELTFSTLAYGFAASFLGITGFESAAQIVETLEQPVMVTVRKLYKAVIILVSITAPVVSILCLTILTPEEVMQNKNYLLSGLSLKIGGSFLLFLIVVDATLTLFAAVNTAFVGFIGLAATMAKHGNLPQIFLKRVNHWLSFLEGYPVIALMMMVLVMLTSSFVAGAVEITAKVYEIAFLGVMVSFAVGVILMRNKGYRKLTPTRFLSKFYIQIHKFTLPLPPLFTAAALSFAVYMLVFHSSSASLLLFTVLFGSALLVMAYYRWGMLENRLETHTDLRLGLGRFRSARELPEDCPKFILCVGTHRIRVLINKTLDYICKQNAMPFELILFYAEEEEPAHSNVHFYEVLQRVVSQQVAPLHAKRDIILTVKILPEKLIEGLEVLKKTIPFKAVYFGVGREPDHSYELKDLAAKETEIQITSIF